LSLSIDLSSQGFFFNLYNTIKDGSLGKYKSGAHQTEFQLSKGWKPYLLNQTDYIDG